MAADRDLVALVGAPFRGVSLNASTDSGAVTVVASDSGILFVNEYAGTTTYTLPTVSLCKGKWFGFYANVANNIAITGGTTDVLTGGNTSAVVDADTVTLTGVVGGWGIIIGDGTHFIFLAGTGTWTASG